MTERWPVTIQAVGPVAVATRIWRHRGSLHVTTLAKATFGFVPDGPMRLEEPMGINIAEVPGGPARTTSAWAPSDLVPLLPRADVTFVGHAYAPARTGARTVRARLALSRPRTPGAGPQDGPLLLDKSLDVVGTRTATAAWPNPPAALFTRMPLVYERAFGGNGHHSNPIGTGAETDQRGRVHLPNIVHPPHTAVPVEPAGFAPVPMSWPLRTRLLPGLGDILRSPVASLPDGVDLGHFHAAPFDQRIEFLRGDEWIILDKLNPKIARLATRLPDATGVARVYTRDGEQHTLVMRADSLWIDGDGERCCVVWRGSFPVPSDATLPLLSISAGIELPGVATHWPFVDWPRSQVIEIERRPAATNPVADTVSLATRRTERGPALGSTAILTPELADDLPPPTMVLSSSFVRGGTLVIDTELAEPARSPFLATLLIGVDGKGDEARASSSAVRGRSGLAEEDTVDADSSSAGPQDGGSSAVSSSAVSLLEVTSPRASSPSATLLKSSTEGPPSSSVALGDDDIEVDSMRSERAPAHAPVPRPVRSDPTRDSGVVPLSAWRDDDDDDDDDAETHARPAPEMGPPSHRNVDLSLPDAVRGDALRQAIPVRTHTPPPDSVERPTSSSPKTTRRKGNAES